jgi:hypothetical protein
MYAKLNLLSPKLRLLLTMRLAQRPNHTHKQILLFLILVLFVAAGLIIQSVLRPNTACASQEDTPTPTPTGVRFSQGGGCCKPGILVLTLMAQIEVRRSNVIPHLCGKLVFVTNYKTGLQEMALLPCTGSGQPYILKTHPRDVIPYYQFRNARISGTDICTLEYGCLSKAIAIFDNYVGINNCNECGLFGVPPTWTQPPKFTYTPTPTPTPTLSPTPVTPSATPTQTVVTPTIPLSQLIFGTPEPTFTNTASPIPTPQPVVPTVTQTPAGGFPGNLCTGGLGIIVLSSGLVALVLGLRMRQGL